MRRIIVLGSTGSIVSVGAGSGALEGVGSDVGVGSAGSGVHPVSASRIDSETADSASAVRRDDMPPLWTRVAHGCASDGPE